jgi:hypothetical protein
MPRNFLGFNFPRSEWVDSTGNHIHHPSFIALVPVAYIHPRHHRRMLIIMYKTKVPGNSVLVFLLGELLVPQLSLLGYTLATHIFNGFNRTLLAPPCAQ